MGEEITIEELELETLEVETLLVEAELEVEPKIDIESRYQAFLKKTRGGK